MRGYSVSDISNDTTVDMRRQRTLMTEWAVKNYVGMHGGGILDTALLNTLYKTKDSLSIRGSSTVRKGAHWGASLFIGGTNFEYPNEFQSGSSPHGLGELIISPNIGRNGMGSWNNIIYAPSGPDNTNSFNTLIGQLTADGTNANFGNNNTVLKSGNVPSWTSFGFGNIVIGAGNMFGADYNILIGSDVLTQAGAPSFDGNGNAYTTKNASNQINIGNYIFKDSIGHLGVGRWSVDNSTAVDLGGFSNGGMQIPHGSTSQRLAITLPAEGLLFYDNTLHSLCYYNGTKWQRINSSDAD